MIDPVERIENGDFDGEDTFQNYKDPTWEAKQDLVEFMYETN